MTTKKKPVNPEIVESETDELVPVAQSAPGTMSRFTTDADLEVAGKWFRDVGSGMRLKIAHGDNERYNDYLQQLIRPYIGLIQSNSKEGYAAFRRFQAKARARFVLVDWDADTILDADGNPIPYSEEQAFEWLSKPEFRPFQNIVATFSGDDSAFRLDREQVGKG